jgi:hypothetical protein
VPDVDKLVLVTGSHGEDSAGRLDRTRAWGAAVDQDLGSLRDHIGSDWTAPGAADAAGVTGDDVLADGVRAGQEAFGERLLAAYALGVSPMAASARW